MVAKLKSVVFAIFHFHKFISHKYLFRLPKSDGIWQHWFGWISLVRFFSWISLMFWLNFPHHHQMAYDNTFLYSILPIQNSSWSHMESNGCMRGLVSENLMMKVNKACTSCTFLHFPFLNYAPRFFCQLLTEK